MSQSEQSVAPLFRDREWQSDAFGLGAFYKSAEGNFAGSLNGSGANSRQFCGRPGWGLGLGASYFFQRYLGIGVEQDVFGRTAGVFRQGDFGYIRWATIGNLFIRYPIEAWHLAPYAMVGGGAFYGDTPDMTLKLGRGRTTNYKLYPDKVSAMGGRSLFTKELGAEGASGLPVFIFGQVRPDNRLCFLMDAPAIALGRFLERLVCARLQVHKPDLYRS